LFLRGQLPGDGVADLFDWRALEAVPGRRAAAARPEEDALLDQGHFLGEQGRPVGDGDKAGVLDGIVSHAEGRDPESGGMGIPDEFHDNRVAPELPELRAARDDEAVVFGEILHLRYEDVAPENDVARFVIAAPVFDVDADLFHCPAPGLDLLLERKISVAEPFAEEDEDAQGPRRAFRAHAGRPQSDGHERDKGEEKCDLELVFRRLFLLEFTKSRAARSEGSIFSPGAI